MTLTYATPGRVRTVTEVPPPPPIVVPSDRNRAWDGLRGVAVAAVLAYHLGWSQLRGGFLGVSAFFTLSGFLITTLLLRELQGSSTLSLRDFWARRVRRLLPATLVCIGMVLAFGELAATGTQRARLRGDTLATLAEVANWRYYFTGQDYGGTQFALSGRASPLLHTWSLSIEEQCYVLLPLLLLLAWRLGRRRGVAVAIWTAIGATFAASLLSAGNPMLVYYGTHVRALELLIGALGAYLVTTRHAPRLRSIARWLAPFALIGILWSWTVASETSIWLPRGGFAAHAIATCAVVIAVTGGGWLASLLAVRPLAALGRISFGVYLYHWPIFLWLTPLRLHRSPADTAVIRLAVTLAVASLSFAFIEHPALRTRRRPGRVLTLGAGALAGAMTVAIVLTPPPTTGAAVTIAAGQQLEAPLGPAGADSPAPTGRPAPAAVASPPVTSPPTTAPPTTVTTATTGATDEPADATASSAAATTVAPTTIAPTPEQRLQPALARAAPPAHPPTIMVVGDSTAGTLGNGVRRWGAATGQAKVWVGGWFLCPITRSGTIRWLDGKQFKVDPGCDAWPKRREWEEEHVKPDVAVVLSGMWEVADRQFPGTTTWTHIGEPGMDARITADLSRYADVYLSQGTRLVWLLVPPLRSDLYAQLPGPFDEDDPARVARLNQIIRQVAATHPGMYVLDLPGVFKDRLGDAGGFAHRVDGFHWSDAGADADAKWLGPLLLQVAAQPR